MSFPPAPTAPDRPRGMTLLGRESALARVASGEVRQMTPLLLDPARVRIWPGNARNYGNLTEKSCRELIDSSLAEGGQKVPQVVRRVQGDPLHDYELIAGTQRHWSISWLRASNYPDMVFLAQVQVIDDESAFRLADLDNRARKDVSDLERARNYASALHNHYGGRQRWITDLRGAGQGASRLMHLNEVGIFQCRSDSISAAVFTVAATDRHIGNDRKWAAILRERYLDTSGT